MKTLKEMLRPPFRCVQFSNRIFRIFNQADECVCIINPDLPVEVRGFVADSLNEKMKRDFGMCDEAERLPDGKCVGYSKKHEDGTPDDEPPERCMNCKENQFYEGI